MVISFQTEIIIITLLILFNALLSFSEMSIIASDRLKIKKMAADGSLRARSLILLLDQPSRFLSSIQIGITLIGILAGAFGGATIAEELESYFGAFVSMNKYAEFVSVGIVVIVTTFFSILFGELIPKRLALLNPEKYALIVARPIGLMIRSFLPLVSMFGWMTDKIIFFFSFNSENKKSISKDYLKNVIEQSTEEGSLTATEQDFLYNFLVLDNIKVENLMTRRGEVIFLDVNDDFKEYEKTVLNYNFDFFPLCDESLDNVIGIIESKEFLKNSAVNRFIDVKSIAKKPLFIPDKISALQLLESFRKFRLSVALVVDEFGGVEGIISLSDILNEFFIELHAIRKDKSELVKNEDGSYFADGSLPIDKIKDLLDVMHLPDEGRYTTLAGFLLDRMQKIPSKNDSLIYSEYRFEILSMDGNRIGRVRIIKN